MTRPLALAVLLLGACAAETPPPDAARMPPDALGGFADADVTSINLASWAFASPSNTRGRPIDAARAVAAVDYLAGQLSVSPRWDFMSPLTKMQMLQARAEVRQAAGIAPDAPSQLVVDRLVAAARHLQEGDQTAADAALTSPAFSQPPAATMQRLASLPYLPRTNVATSHAAAQEFPRDGFCPFCF